ncbi:PQQ-dependent sugar dehydrogenase [Oricola cellulosilytica]|uniref:PQQ-dependent sugar dehydrogenase n=1 Tax=Oricola cellulosilytica TaxID=1429082 RepID=A0A4R0P8C4_9HYPH|nr:PQQ-dependent sugar dehydrogenase [Oricola cellulosilytica]TCD13314.1 PQQ-dependent sugar dehydrogenase [Oricola cellulosilytica]
MRLTTIFMALSLSAAPFGAGAFTIEGTNGTVLEASEIAEFNEPWALTFLPDGTMLVTEKSGTLLHVTQEGGKTKVDGLWDVAYGGQGGLGDVILHPAFAENGLVYVSYAEASENGSTIGAAVVRATLNTSGGRPTLTGVERIWTQVPKVRGQGHYSHRMAFGPDGMLFITSGDRQKKSPAQDFEQNLGKIVRLNDDGSVPPDNPWQERGELAKQFWTAGHRNLLGIAFDGEGRLWTHEMGPRHGDELNLITAGENYGWPLVSNGDNYSGIPIPDHDTRPEFNAPEAFWVPSIAPAGLVIYDGDAFEGWEGDALIGGLVSEALIHVDLEGETAAEAERFAWGKRIREVEQGPGGALWVLEDRAGGRLLKLEPADAG